MDRWRQLTDRLIDCDLAVDDARRDLDQAVDRLREAVRIRNAAARHLQQLTAWCAAHVHEEGAIDG